MSLRRPTVACYHILFSYEASPRPSFGPVIFIFWISGGLPPDFQSLFSVHHILFRLHFCWNTHMHSCWHLLYLKSELSCEYIQSTHLACWFGQMWTKAISWMKSSIASPTLRGVPVSLLWSWSWSLFYNRFRLPPNKFIGSHSDTRWTVIYWSHVTHYTVTYPSPFYYELVVYHPTIVSYPPLCIIKVCL